MTQLGAMGLSLAIEVPIALIVLRQTPPRRRDTLLAALAATLMTHPIAWNAILFLSPKAGYVVATAGVELAVAAVEAVAYAWTLGIPARRALLTSVLANGASFGAGVVLQALGRF